MHVQIRLVYFVSILIDIDEFLDVQKKNDEPQWFGHYIEILFISSWVDPNMVGDITEGGSQYD